MPLYEYECDNCGHRFEVIQKFSDEPVKTCPKCQGAVRKLLSSPAIQFKGSGWYITDYAKKSGSGAAPARSEGTSSEKSSESSTSSSSSSSDSAAKSEAPAKSSTPSK